MTAPSTRAPRTGLEELDEGDVTVENDKITAADGYTMLDAKQVNAAGDAIK